MRSTSMGGVLGGNPAAAAAMAPPPAEDDNYGPPSALEQFLPHAILAATGVGAGAVDEFVMPKVHRAWGRFSNKYFPMPIKKASYGGDMRNEMFIRGLVDGLAKLGFTVGAQQSAGENPLMKQMRLQKKLKTQQTQQASSAPKPDFGPPADMPNPFMPSKR